MVKKYCLQINELEELRIKYQTSYQYSYNLLLKKRWFFINSCTSNIFLIFTISSYQVGYLYTITKAYLKKNKMSREYNQQIKTFSKEGEMVRFRDNYRLPLE